MGKKFQLIWDGENKRYSSYAGSGADQYVKVNGLIRCQIDVDRAEEALRSSTRIDDEFIAAGGDKTDPNKMIAVIDAIGTLDPDDKAHFTAGGLPNAVVLSELTGMRVSCAMRDEAWAAFNG